MDEKRLLSGVYRLLGRRIRTKKEIIDWLDRKGATPETKEQILQKLIQLKLIDDLSYAESFIRTRLLFKRRSLRVLKMELSQKGISKDVIEEALQSNEVDDEKTAKDLVESNQWRWQKYAPEQRKQKTMEFLMRKGFNFDVIKKAVQ